MSWTAVKGGKLILGFEVQTVRAHYFFGTAHLSRERMIEMFPQYEFYFLRQVHGDVIVKGNQGLATADGHWTSEPNKALVIQTADCIPLLFGANQFAVAIHAGWRGVE